MSITAVMGNAISGLSVSQKSLQVTSNNIANVNTEGYARMQVFQQSRTLSAEGAGVEVAEVRRIVDEFIVRELRLATAHAGRYEAMTDLHKQIQSLLGAPADNLSLPGKLDAVLSTFASLALEPDSVPLRNGLVADLTALATEFNRLSDAIQTLRGEADRRIGIEVAKANDAIARIYDLNQQILREERAGRDAPGLKDQRAQALDELASVLDIRTFPLTNGMLGVSTISGIALLDNTLHKLVHTPTGTVSAETAFDQITVNSVNPATGVVSPIGSPLDPEVQAGSLRGLLDMRDLELPALALEIGELASRVADQINQIHNDNVAVPPAGFLTGRNTGLDPAEAHNFTGIATFYAFDANNDVTNQVTIDFAAVGPSFNDVIAAVNAGLGGDGVLAMAGGMMSFTAGGAATGIGIQQDATTPSDRVGRGFSAFFGMNDLLEAKSEAHFETGVAATDAQGFTGTMNLQFRGPDNQVVVDTVIDFAALGGSFATVEAALDTQFAGYADFSFGAAGELVVTPAPAYADYKVHVVDDASDRFGTGMSFSRMFGLGEPFRMQAASGMQVVPAVAADPGLVALAKVDATGSPAVAISDGRGARQLQELSLTEITFDAAGALPGLTMTLSSYSAQVLGDAGARAATAEGLGADRTALVQELTNRLAEVQGVNLDEELSNMVIFQNSFNAAGRLIQTAREMFDVLVSL